MADPVPYAPPPKAAKKRFAFSALKGGKAGAIKRDEWGDDVRAVQTFLTETGYLRRDRVPGCLCGWTSNALRHFQKCYGLAETGEGDADTLELMQRPRCGNPDVAPTDGTGSGPAPFVLRGCRYPQTDLTYAFFNDTADLPAGRGRAIVREAFAAWAAVSPLRFFEVGPADRPTFSVSWQQGGHGDGSPFDNGGSFDGNVLAHAFYPPPCGGPFAGALHFDDFEIWTDAAAPNAIRLLNVAIHEIGHLLGLDHSNTRDAIMFAFYADNVDRLRPDDIEGIQTLYGRPAGVTPIRGQLQRTGDSQVHRVAVRAGRLRVLLRGPAGQDFDLYVRSGGAPTRAAFDARGFGPTADEEVRLTVSGGEVFILVDSWSGAGAYELLVTPE